MADAGVVAEEETTLAETYDELREWKSVCRGAETGEGLRGR